MYLRTIHKKAEERWVVGRGRGAWVVAQDLILIKRISLSDYGDDTSWQPLTLIILLLITENDMNIGKEKTNLFLLV